MPSTAKHEGIIVLGCPRSGTTLVRRLLNAHPAIACPGETHLFTACARFLSSERGLDGMDIGVLSGLSFAGFESEDIVARLREFAFGLRREHASREGKRRWAEKTAVDAFHIEQISRLCGDHAYFICVTRHGLDVACSLREWCDRSQVFLDELHGYIRRYNSPLVAFCHAWVDVTNALRTFVDTHAANAVAVRYEDLVQDPQSEMTRILEFVGEDWDPALLSTSQSSELTGFSDWKALSRKAIDGSSTGRWRRELPDATIADLASIVNPTLADCGYESIEIRGDDSEEEARRRYELGLLLQRAKPPEQNAR